MCILCEQKENKFSFSQWTKKTEISCKCENIESFPGSFVVPAFADKESRGKDIVYTEYFDRLADNFKTISCLDCPKLKKLVFSDTLQKLVVQNCPEVFGDHVLLPYEKRFPKLPKTLKILHLVNNHTLKFLQNITTDLDELVITGCPELKQLHFCDLKGESLPALPDCITDLRITNCINLKSLPALPPKLAVLKIFHCDNLTELPALPSTVANIVVYKCQKLSQLPPLPVGLDNLSVTNCPSLCELPPFPPTISFIDCTATSVHTLPTLPENLRSLYCRDCPDLVQIPELPSRVCYPFVTHLPYITVQTADGKYKQYNITEGTKVGRVYRKVYVGDKDVKDADVGDADKDVANGPRLPIDQGWLDYEIKESGQPKTIYCCSSCVKPVEVKVLPKKETKPKQDNKTKETKEAPDVKTVSYTYEFSGQCYICMEDCEQLLPYTTGSCVFKKIVTGGSIKYSGISFISCDNCPNLEKLPVIPYSATKISAQNCPKLSGVIVEDPQTMIE